MIANITRTMFVNGSVDAVAEPVAMLATASAERETPGRVGSRKT